MTTYWSFCDFEKILDAAGDNYTYEDLCKFFRSRYDLTEYGEERIDFLERNARHDLLYWHNGKFICSIFLEKKTLHSSMGVGFMCASDDQINELETICLFLLGGIRKIKQFEAKQKTNQNNLY